MSRQDATDAVSTALAAAAVVVQALLALLATLGSLFFSEISQFVPCRLCWFQRIGMYPLAAILLIAAIRRDHRGGALYGLPLVAFGSLVAIYHIYIEYHPEAETAGCKIGAPCSTKWIDKLGYITIPVFALTAFVAIGVLLTAALTRSRATSATRTRTATADAPTAQPAESSGNAPA